MGLLRVDGGPVGNGREIGVSDCVREHLLGYWPCQPRDEQVEFGSKEMQAAHKSHDCGVSTGTSIELPLPHYHSGTVLIYSPTVVPRWQLQSQRGGALLL